MPDSADCSPTCDPATAMLAPAVITCCGANCEYATAAVPNMLAVIVVLVCANSVPPYVAPPIM